MNPKKPTIHPTFDAEGYPTEETEQAISQWRYDDFNGLLHYVAESWNHNYGRMRKENGFVTFATGGWSGNEAIIHAMQENYVLWAMLWESSHRGGLYVLRVPNVSLNNL